MRHYVKYLPLLLLPLVAIGIPVYSALTRPQPEDIVAATITITSANAIVDRPVSFKLTDPADARALARFFPNFGGPNSGYVVNNSVSIQITLTTARGRQLAIGTDERYYHAPSGYSREVRPGLYDFLRNTIQLRERNSRLSIADTLKLTNLLEVCVEVGGDNTPAITTTAYARLKHANPEARPPPPADPGPPSQPLRPIPPPRRPPLTPPLAPNAASPGMRHHAPRRGGLPEEFARSRRRSGGPALG